MALIAGLHDVSAVATSWKLNLVSFDTVFSRTRHTWSWSSPDVLYMLDKGATPDRIDVYCYDGEFDNFTQNAIHSYLRVVDHMKDLLAAAAKNKTLVEDLRQEKVPFFLHALGLDTTGHITVSTRRST